MPQQVLSVGTQPNDRTGDSARAGALKINSNFSELYAGTGIGNTAGGVLAGGTDAQRPGVPTAAMFRWSVTGLTIEWHNGTGWIRPVPQGGATLTGIYQFPSGAVATPSVAVGGAQAGLASLVANGFSLIAGQREQLRLTPTTTAVNYLEVSGAAAGISVRLRAEGTDTNIPVVLSPKGTGAMTAQLPDSAVGGGNARGNYATDWQRHRVLATEVASGGYAVVGGGYANRASGNNSAVLSGNTNNATGSGAVVAGGLNNTADGANSVVIGGSQATTRGTSGKAAFGNGFFAAAGDAQACEVVMRVQTANATATRLTTDGAALAAANANALPNNGVYTFQISLGARNTTTNECSGWVINGVVKRGANAAATALVGTPTTNMIGQDGAASTWVVAVSADTTNGALAVTVTGVAATTIRWVAAVDTVEIA
jgi:hypothetical protein